MPYYKAEVNLHSITSDEYDSRTLEGDQSIYVPQPNPMFACKPVISPTLALIILWVSCLDFGLHKPLPENRRKGNPVFLMPCLFFGES